MCKKFYFSISIFLFIFALEFETSNIANIQNKFDMEFKTLSLSQGQDGEIISHFSCTKLDAVKMAIKWASNTFKDLDFFEYCNALGYFEDQKDAIVNTISEKKGMLKKIKTDN